MKEMPFVYLCTGMSLDGKICGKSKRMSRISSEDDRDMLYDSRVRADAVMVGGNTLVQDDPSLTVKRVSRQNIRVRLGKPPEPMKVGIISDAGKIKLNGSFINKGGSKVLIFTTKKTSKLVIKKLEDRGVAVCVIGGEKVNLKKVLKLLYTKYKVKQLMVEGGGELIFSLLKDKLIDEVNLKIGDLIIGGRDSITFVEGDGFLEDRYVKLKFKEIKKVGTSILLKANIVK